MRYHAFRLPDLEPLHGALDLRDVSLYRGVNEPGELRGSLDKAQAYSRIFVESDQSEVQLMRDQGTLIIADDGSRAWAFIADLITQDADHQDRLAISAVGFGHIPDQQPWLTDLRKYVDTDPLDIVRDIWAYLSDQENGLVVSVDSTSSPVTVGEEEEDVEFTTGQGEDVSFQAGPYKLVWYQADDLLKHIDDLSEETPFEWRERTIFDRRSDAPPQFHIELGYPRLESAVRDNLHFTVGVNVRDVAFEDEEDYFSEVLVLGNGEGQSTKRGRGYRRRVDRLRRVKVIEDNSLMSNRLCEQRAQEEADRADREGAFINQCTVMEHPAAPITSFDVGDTITIMGRFTWGEHRQDCRIVSIDHNVDAATASLELERLPE